jgi:hypothetical protein
VTWPRSSVVLAGWLQAMLELQLEGKAAEVTMVAPEPDLGTRSVWVTLPRASRLYWT